MSAESGCPHLLCKDPGGVLAAQCRKLLSLEQVSPGPQPFPEGCSAGLGPSLVPLHLSSSLHPTPLLLLTSLTGLNSVSLLPAAQAKSLESSSICFSLPAASVPPISKPQQPSLHTWIPKLGIGDPQLHFPAPIHPTVASSWGQLLLPTAPWSASAHGLRVHVK